MISPRHRNLSRLRLLVSQFSTLSLFLLLGASVGHAQSSTIAYVQSNYADPQTPQTTVAVPYTAAQTAGNLNVVVVGWSDSTAQVQTVADTKGNVYVLAVGPTVQTGTATQAIYYAKNIAAAAANGNAVTVTFNVAANFPDIRIAEYGGLDPVNPLDVVVAAAGSSTTSNSGAVTTTNANDLLVAANLVQTLTTGPGTGYTQRLITNPDADILEDRVVTAIGSYSATAPVSPSGAWIMPMVAFRAASGGTPAPSIASLSPTSGPVGTSVTITGANFGTTQGSSTVTFNGTMATPGSWTATSIVVPVPSGATTGNVVVTVSAVSSNGVNFTVGVLSAISFVQSNSTTPQASLTTVTVPFTLAQTAGNLNVIVVGWNDSTAIISSVADSIGNTYAVAAAPVVQSGTATQAIYYAKNIAAAGAGANTITVSFATAARHPDIRIAEYSGLDPLNPLDTSAGAQGNTATSDSGSVVTANPNDLLVGANTVQSTTTGPGAGYTSRGITGDGDILEDRVASASGNYNATAVLNTVQLWIMQMAAFRAAGSGGGTVPNIASLNPTSGPIGTSVTITGANFGTSQGTSTVTFNGTTATPTSWSTTSIVVPVPTGATTGNVVVTVGGIASNGVLFAVQSGTPAIKLIQHVGKDAGSTTSSTLAFPANNTAGNWIAVAIRAGRSGQLFTVTDTRGNTYRRAVQFNVTADTPNGDTLGIFYAENIAGGANSVTVSDSINGSALRFAILEYSGIASANSLDVTAAAQGTSAAPNSGTVATTAAGDLLFGVVVTSNAATYVAGTGFTVEDRVPAAPSTKLMDEDQIQTAAGNASASASLGTSDIWAAALAAFRAASGGGATGPSITSISPASGAVGTSVTISGLNFGSTQGSSTVTFNGTIATPMNWTATTIMVVVPAGASTGNVVVTVGGFASNGVSFAVLLPPSITSLTPNSGAIGTSVTIAGANFGTSQGSSTVTFNGIAAAPTNWTATSIAAPVPNGATTGNVVVTVGGVLSNGVAFTVTNPGPSISTLSLSQGPVGASITITGLNFGALQGASTLTFGGAAATPTSWSDTSINAPVPSGATTGVVIVTVNNVASNGVPFTITPPPVINNISPIAGPIGTVVTINGTNFGPTIGTRASVVSFNGITARPNNWSDTQILVPVPAGATTGNVVVSLSGVLSNGVNFTVATPPSITNLNPSSGPVGTSVTISGANFGATQGTSAVTFNGLTASPTSWNDLTITVPVPSGASTGNVVVTVNGLASPGVNFTVPSSGAPIALVQHTRLDAGTTTSASLAFPATNTAGNFIAVVIRAGTSGQVFAVTDAKGNTYRKAIQFNETLDGTTLGVFYAESIAGGPNTINVSDTNAGTLRFAILEYSGVALVNSLDAAAMKQGTGTSPTSGTLITSMSGDLLLAGISTANAASFTAGSGYLAEEFVPLAPNTKLFVEDQIQAAPAQVSAGASLGASDNWGAILAAFKSASAAPPPPITVTVVPATASVGTGGGTQLFTAQLVNDIQIKGVTWSLAGVGCSGSTCGALSQATATTVSFTGPVAIPNPATVTLTATSVADTSKSSTATITVVQGPLAVALSPKRGSITASQTQQFTATVFNDPNNAGVTWQVDGNTNGNSTTGTISATGLFTPGIQPGLHTITATSVTDASASASVSFAVTDLPGVLMHHNDPGRTGQNLKEYALTPVNVRSSAFTQLFSCPVDGYVYAQPLWVPNLTVGAVLRNVLFIATEHDSVYAFDADSPSCTQLWKRSFLGTGVTTMPWQDTSLGSSSLATNDVFPEIGITSTPVIDVATNTIYVVAKTKETVGTGCSSGSPCYISRLHAMDLATGAEKFGGPVAISAPNFSSLRHFNRPGLLLANNTIYIGFGSHGDITNWQGWLFGYDTATLAQKFVFSTSDPTSGSGGAALWGGGAGPAADASGNIYVTTGNGSYDGVKNFSESVLKISPTGTLLDWFTPSNRSTLDANDVDLGSAGMMILPDSVGSTAHPHLAMATGKIAILYLLDQANLGKFHSSSNQDVQEVIPVPPPNTTQLDGGIYGLPAYWNGFIYTTGQNFPLSQFRISNGSMATPQSAVSSNQFPPRGATPSVSANGNTNGIVWVLDLSGWSSNANAILYAYDASDVSNMLFSSPSTGADAAGPAVKFTVPTIANGKVYIGGQSRFTVFGLLPN